MKTSTKKLGLLFLLVALFACFAFGLTLSLNTTKADVVTPTLTTFTTKDGAEIKVSDDTGIRFTAQISKGEYDDVLSLDANAKFGMAIARVENQTQLDAMISGGMAVHFEMGAGKWNTGKTPDTDGVTTLEYSFTINNIASGNYSKNYTAKAYVEVNGTKYYSTVTNDTATTRSPLIVAIGYVTVVGGDTFANQVVSAAQPELVFDSESYTVDGSASVKPVVKVNGVPVVVTITSDDPATVSIAEDGSLIANKVGTTKITATVNGTDTDTFTKKADVNVTAVSVQPTIADNGILSLETKGEATTVTVNDGTTDIITESLDADETTFDIYDAIISYRETNDIVDTKAYTVKVRSTNYAGSVTTDEIVAISTKLGMMGEAKNSRKDSGKYYYLTNDIVIAEAADTVGQTYDKSGYCYFINNGSSPVYMNLDGRGHSLTLDSVKGGTSGKRIMFYRIDNSYFKNIIIDTDIEGKAHDDGILATYVHNSTFENCYFNITMNDLSTATTAQPVIRNNYKNNFDGCLFNIVNANENDTHGITISGIPDSDISPAPQNYTNCAVIYSATQVSELFDENNNISETSTISLYASFAELGDDWKVNGTISNVWGINTETDYVTFKGKDLFSIGKITIECTITANGLISFDTNGEATQVIVNDGSTDIITEDLDAGITTFDLYDAIISYRETEEITDAKSYTVKLSSNSYACEFTTATFTVISDMAGMQAEALASSATSNKYYYLTNNIEFIENNNTGYINGCTIFAQKTNAPIYMNFDGRGYSLKLHAVRTAGQNARMMFYRIDGSSFINTIFDTNLEGIAHNSGILATYIHDSKFENCYFNITMKTLTTPSRHQPVIRNNVRNEFVNCVFNLVDSTADEFDITISGSPDSATRQTYTNCAVISSMANVADLFASNNAITNNGISLYTSLANLVATEKTNVVWNGALKVTETGVTICGKAAATVTA